METVTLTEDNTTCSQMEEQAPQVSSVDAGTASHMMSTFTKCKEITLFTHMGMKGENFLHSPVQCPYPSFNIPQLEIFVQSVLLLHQRIAKKKHPSMNLIE